MNIILKIRNWKLFIILSFAYMIALISIPGTNTIKLIINVVSSLIVSFWYLTLGDQLNNLLPKQIRRNYNFFIFNCLYIILWSVILIIVFDGKYNFTGYDGIFGIYLAIAIFQIVGFIAKTLKTIELNRIPGIGEFIGDLFLFFLWPIGIWFLQPRINKIASGD